MLDAALLNAATLDDALRRYTGKDLTPLRDLVAGHTLRSGVLPLLVRRTFDVQRETNFRIAASWILKGCGEKGVVPAGKTRTTFWQGVAQHAHEQDAQLWPLTLQLLQLMPHVPQAPSSLLAPLLAWGDHSNTFVRAWSYNAIAHLGAQHRHLQDDVRAHLQAAQFGAKASVQVRLRNLFAANGWLC